MYTHSLWNLMLDSVNQTVHIEEPLITHVTVNPSCVFVVQICVQKVLIGIKCAACLSLKFLN